MQKGTNPFCDRSTAKAKTAATPNQEINAPLRCDNTPEEVCRYLVVVFHFQRPIALVSLL